VREQTLTWKRREFLKSSLGTTAGFSAVGLGMADAREAGIAPLQIPFGGGPIPHEWQSAARMALWPGAAPDHVAHRVPRGADWPATFLNGVVQPDLHLFRPQRSNGRAVLVIPGGAYTFVSIRNEGTDVARVFTERGYTVFVLTYRLPGEGWARPCDVPLCDAQRAMRVIRSRAGIDGFDPESTGVVGFSAGGHLAASLLTDHAQVLQPPVDSLDTLSARPRCGILIYPVIAVDGPLSHALSAQRLLGAAPDAQAIARRSPADHVDGTTPPVFMAHALDDPAVPWQNTMKFAEALGRQGKFPEMHLFGEGGHGFGIGPANGTAGQWPKLAMQWEERLAIVGKAA
jgi:acetyl esterase/lipase